MALEISGPFCMHFALCNYLSYQLAFFLLHYHGICFPSLQVHQVILYYTFGCLLPCNLDSVWFGVNEG
jgi:hypothetical protein